MNLTDLITADFREMKQAQDHYRDLKANDAPQSQIYTAFREFKEKQAEYRNWKDPKTDKSEGRPAEPRRSGGFTPGLD
jgi:hypothetical protein